MPDSTVPPRPQRASDADRAYVSQVVHRAVGMGMLTLDEADDRLGAVYAAQYRTELAALVDDLPVDEPAMGAAPVDAATVNRWEQVQAATWRRAETAQDVLTRSRIGAWLLFLLVFMIILSLLAGTVPVGGHGGGMPGGGGGIPGR
ncbi:DUF1707 domain-containing protein [Nakamurella flavida]|uniref:DUF1707 domain-containing protein n=1 Tax=Nakamurella flavida TaxID=363630 RepID=A0A938YRD9_9ACTN|nr:DUF1707 domain-containing protein [Nakamurella flavida]MBM9478047.1 DUF1707 domain-containing protein [Nakamurella flavida]MDP9778236.1 hypothetical protein [Nakamurella flavida]